MEPTSNKCVIDLEASGLSSLSYPIEVGVVLDNGKQYQSLIRPLDDWTHWDLEAESLHGITRTELQRYGKPVRQVCQEINDFCLGQTLFSDCWVFDNSWLNTLFAGTGVSRRFACAPIEMMLAEPQLARFNQCKNAVAEYYAIAKHRAMNDALIIQRALRLLQNSMQNSTQNSSQHSTQTSYEVEELRQMETGFNQQPAKCFLI